jgi:UrcA family protein
VGRIQLALIATLASAAALMVPAMPARAADSSQVASETVHFADLDLTSRKGAERLYIRLQNAAGVVCDDDGEYVDLYESREVHQCEQKALETAVAQIDRPLVTSLYDRHFPHEALVASVNVTVPRA